MKSTFLSWLKACFVIAAYAWLVTQLVSQAQSVEWASYFAQWPWGVAAIFWVILANAIGYWGWKFVLAAEASVDLNLAYSAYSASTIAKYLPLGKIFQFTSFAVAYPNNVTAPMLAFAVLLLMNLVAGAAMALPGIVEVWMFLPSWAIWVLAFAILIFAWLLRTPKLLVRPIQYLRPSWKISFPDRLPVTTLLVMFVVGILAWSANIGSQAAILEFMDRDVGFSDLMALQTTFFLACLASYVAIFSPSGFGAIEGVMFLMLRSRFSEFDAALLALLSRLAMIIGDLAFAAPYLFSRFRALGRTLRTNG